MNNNLSKQMFKLFISIQRGNNSNICYDKRLLKKKCLEHRQPFVEPNKQSAAARENRTPRDSDVTRKRKQAAGAAAIWLGNRAGALDTALLINKRN